MNLKSPLSFLNILMINLIIYYLFFYLNISFILSKFGFDSFLLKNFTNLIIPSSRKYRNVILNGNLDFILVYNGSF